ncbi:MAG: hypothetical protein RBR86_02430 [Pseudobdellovibrionaceae bacterium]|jgi:hypothetical protein|nr:hypothetical protein [Pseudobdellovibrionaceae bacterium]
MNSSLASQTSPVALGLRYNFDLVSVSGLRLVALEKFFTPINRAAAELIFDAPSTKGAAMDEILATKVGRVASESATNLLADVWQDGMPDNVGRAREVYARTAIKNSFLRLAFNSGALIPEELVSFVDPALASSENAEYLDQIGFPDMSKVVAAAVQAKAPVVA